MFVLDQTIAQETSISILIVQICISFHEWIIGMLNRDLRCSKTTVKIALHCKLRVASCKLQLASGNLQNLQACETIWPKLLLAIWLMSSNCKNCSIWIDLLAHYRLFVAPPFVCLCVELHHELAFKLHPLQQTDAASVTQRKQHHEEATNNNSHNKWCWMITNWLHFASLKFFCLVLCAISAKWMPKATLFSFQITQFASQIWSADAPKSLAKKIRSGSNWCKANSLQCIANRPNSIR